MRFFLLIHVSLFMVNCSLGQQLPSKEYDSHWNKYYMTKNGEEVYVGVKDDNYKNNKPKIRNFVVQNQTDLVLQKEYYESGKIKTLGYFRLIYDTQDENYRWIPDLLWTYYNEDETLIKQLLFCNGVLIKN